MGGIGSFNRESKTLYIGGLQNVPGADMDEIVTRHFREWGQPEYVRVFPDRCYAFVKYKLRLCAEFAKEAMSNQSLDDDELINVRWATDDPNPLAQQRNLMEQRERFMDALKAEGVATKDLSFNYPKEYTPMISAASPPIAAPVNGAATATVAAPTPAASSSSASSSSVRQQQQPQQAEVPTQQQQQFTQEDAQKMHEFYAQYYQYYYPHLYTQQQQQQPQQAQTQAPQISTQARQQQQQQQQPQQQRHHAHEKKEFDYYAHIHAQFKKNRVDERKQKQENMAIYQQRKALDTDGAVDVYPDTSHQFNQQQQQQ